jgi:hypothetical protein
MFVAKKWFRHQLRPYNTCRRLQEPYASRDQPPEIEHESRHLARMLRFRVVIGWIGECRVAKFARHLLPRQHFVDDLRIECRKK